MSPPIARFAPKLECRFEEASYATMKQREDGSYVRFVDHEYAVREARSEAENGFKDAVAKAEAELTVARELVYAKTADMVKDGKTVIDFYRVWLDHERDAVRRLHAEVVARRAALAEAAQELPQTAGTIAHRIRVYRESYSDQIAALKGELAACREALRECEKKAGAG